MIVSFLVPTVSATIEVREGRSNPTVGERYSLTCRVSSSIDSSRMTITYQWRHNGELLSESSPTLAFHPLEVSHTGDYTCQVTLTSSLLQEAIIATSNTHTLEVLSESMHCFTRQQGDYCQFRISVHGIYIAYATPCKFNLHSVKAFQPITG